MTTHRTSRETKPTGLAAPGATLADAIRAVEATDLSPTRRRDMASAIRTVVRLLESAPERLPASPRLLNRRLNEIAPAAKGMTPARWANIRSLLRASLALLGPSAPGRHLNALSPGWQHLWDSMEARALKIGLSRLMRFYSAAGIEPEAVTAETFDRFAEDLRNGILKDPEGALRSARYAWRRACDEVPGWPSVVWPVPPRRADHFSLPWTAFSESLRQDVEGWLAHLRGDDLLTAAPRPLRPESLRNIERRLRAVSSALVLRGRDPATLRGLADLVEPAAVQEALRLHLERTGNKPGPGLAQLATTLLAIARHHVGAPAEVLRKLEALKQRVSPTRHRGMVERNRARLRPFDEPAAVRALLSLPQRLLVQAEAMPSGERAALTVQTALAVELLLVAPIRIKNLAGIDIETHLTRPGRSRNSVVLSFEREEVKNRQTLDYPLPETTVRLLERYLAEFRPLLAPTGSTALFPRRDGRSKGRAALGVRISQTIFKHTGLRMHPHLFRHFAAKMQLEAEPGSHEVVRRVLGHHSLETTIAAYTGTETAAAVRHYDRTIERLRNGGLPR